MIVIIAVLLIVGFFFPPAWLALAGYGIYIFASRKSRRDSAVEERVRRMVTGRQGYAVFSDLYFEAARAYALAKGGVSYPDTPYAISADTVIDGGIYNVVFVKDPRGTAVTVAER